LRQLCQLTRAYVGPEFDFDVQLVLRPDAVPRCQLGSTAAQKVQLAWNTWSRAREFTYAVDDAVFSLAAP
jgi:type VI secretion system protein ImpH